MLCFIQSCRVKIDTPSAILFTSLTYSQMRRDSIIGFFYVFVIIQKAMARLLLIPYRLEKGEKVSHQAANHLTNILIVNLQNVSLDYCICLALRSYAPRRKLHPYLLKVICITLVRFCFSLYLLLVKIIKYQIY